MNETKLSTCENELLTLRPASAGTLENWIIETIRQEHNRTSQQEATNDAGIQFGDEFNEEIKLLAEKMSENVLKHTLKQREPLARVQPPRVQPRKKSRRAAKQLAKIGSVLDLLNSRIFCAVSSSSFNAVFASSNSCGVIGRSMSS